MRDVEIRNSKDNRIRYRTRYVQSLRSDLRPAGRWARRDGASSLRTPIRRVRSISVCRFTEPKISQKPHVCNARVLTTGALPSCKSPRTGNDSGPRRLLIVTLVCVAVRRVKPRFSTQKLVRVECSSPPLPRTHSRTLSALSGNRDLTRYNAYV